MWTVETVPAMGIGGRGHKGEWWTGWIQLWYTARTFVISQCTPPAQ
jgi:hypothetical protein